METLNDIPIWKRAEEYKKMYEEQLENNYKLEDKIEKLTNNWNELKEFIQKELDNNVDGEKSFGGYQCKIILNKIKEIEEDNKGGEENE